MGRTIPESLMYVTILELRALVDVVLLAIETVIVALVTETLGLVPECPNQKEAGPLPAK